MQAKVDNLCRKAAAGLILIGALVIAGCGNKEEQAAATAQTQANQAAAQQAGAGGEGASKPTPPPFDPSK